MQGIRFAAGTGQGLSILTAVRRKPPVCPPQAVADRPPVR